MAWSNSKIFTAFTQNVLANTAQFDLDGAGIDSFLVALYNNTGTPDQTVTAANSAYNTGQWTTTNAITDTGTGAPAGWPTVGRPLVTPTLTAATVTPVMWDAVDTASSTSTTTLAATFGCLVYDDTLATPVAKQGVCFNYFGGSNSVTLGTFTIVWNVSGLMAFTL